MGCVIKLIDAILLLFFLLMSVVIPLFDAQNCLPNEYYPKVLVDLNSWYSSEYGDYLVAEKPHFFVGLIWMEVLVLWPLSIINLVALISSKSWFRTTCLIYGSSVATSMAAILSELLSSGKASDKLKMVYFPFMGFAVLAILRGLLPSSCKPAAVGKNTAAGRKKRA
ncbi:transmembrane protein 97-like [Chenopodium quinoa]|uniref:EXPERA domain-containing protein n=1 Tax=Chenopodium quinoa TaxID=63459 RepID=A0A803M825_CHEQI|nr:transmembrane protein 97-like [Chenopodium quinoa]